MSVSSSMEDPFLLTLHAEECSWGLFGVSSLFSSVFGTFPERHKYFFPVLTKCCNSASNLAHLGAGNCSKKVQMEVDPRHMEVCNLLVEVPHSSGARRRV